MSFDCLILFFLGTAAEYDACVVCITKTNQKEGISQMWVN